MRNVARGDRQQASNQCVPTPQLSLRMSPTRSTQDWPKAHAIGPPQGAERPTAGNDDGLILDYTVELGNTGRSETSLIMSNTCSNGDRSRHSAGHGILAGGL
jgi:hypothetical protein